LIQLLVKVQSPLHCVQKILCCVQKGHKGQLSGTPRNQVVNTIKSEIRNDGHHQGGG